MGTRAKIALSSALLFAIRHSPFANRAKIVLLFILVLAFGLRFWSIGWGMPFAFHSDEQKYMPKAILMLLNGDLNPRYFENPPLLTYVILVELVVYLWVGKLLGFLHSAADIYAQLDFAPTPLYLLARMNAVVLGTGTVLLTYLVAKRLLGEKTGLLAALFLAVAFLHVRDSHYAVNDVPSTFLLMVSFYFATRIYLRWRRDFWIAKATKPRERRERQPQGRAGSPASGGQGADFTQPPSCLSRLSPDDVKRDCSPASPNSSQEPGGCRSKTGGTSTLSRLSRGFAPFAIQMPPKGRLADYLLGGLFLGLSVAAKYSSGLGAVPLVVAHLLAREGSPGCSRGLQPARGVGRGGLRHRLHPAATAARTHLPLLLAGGASLAAFVLSNPYCLLDAPSFLDEFRSQYGWASDPFRTSDQAIGLVILRSLWVGTGPTVLAAALLGLAVLAFQKPREALLLVSFPLAYVVFFLIASDLFFARFAIPMLPFVSILAGYGAVAVLGYGGVDWVFRGALWALAIAALVLPSVVLDVRYNSLMRAEDTRVLLGRWIDVNVPPGSKMAVEGYSFVDTRGRWLGSRKVQYRMEIFSSLRLHPPEFYAREKFDYLVVSSFVYSRYGLNPEAHAESIDSYRQMDAQFPLAASFFPTDDGRELPFLMDEEIAPIYTVLERDRPGPTVKVYRLSEPPRYGVEWGEIAVPADMAPGQRVGVQVAPRNTGNLAWPWEGYNAVRISGRWLDRNGQEVAGLDRRGSLPREVEPGGAVAVQFDLAAPPDPGDYTLRLDLVQENFAWFSNLGARAKDVAVRVR